MRDALGQRGEAIFTVLMTEFHDQSRPIFKPQFLGDKWQYVDFIVELVGTESIIPYFFVQVKTTRTGYTKKLNRLKVKVPQDSIRGIAAYTAPTYIVGIDEVTEKGYIVSANAENITSLSSLSTAFPINKANREILWQEVNDFWSSYRNNLLFSHFNDPDWR
ncbi:MAG TPA: DUF4365 domain-containing protein [Cyanobacteria bacterium UBA11149]|nr:DUF4365 domain-containing protein [Cyanobacteria bacterium UBA11367]HBE56358.1 DUF4365 domain-containing protein [Cyanobacteria bacterium UBA11366]HBK64222.1 DUF4365 domain-containing protein [Cyanobacteria bacterium UBA11166]HBR72785.1 DUF4365 domain-containing protein [Cyanobacteria bacterium UBA11159]HBS69890.1 DUF4365 domain-containing protein [Cyanobacteria bacterium UBA11153]HBW91801.1 DUF4365 domain-containing protein [Cyanobacteria bacterium UBA11149]HCA93771.1 DUF4365 domain-conta